MNSAANIEVRGVNFVNKGAELMLHAVLQELARWPEMPSPVLGFGEGNHRGGRRLGVARLALLRKRWIDFRLPSRLWPRQLQRWTGLVPEQDVDAVLDASGYGYGDPWGARPLESLLRFLRRWDRPGRFFVMLPQALGPFDDPRTRRAMTAVLPYVDLLFARDPESLAHVQSLIGDDPRVSLAPDFTIQVQGHLPDHHRALADGVCLVPNIQMLRGKASRRGAYRKLFVALLESAQRRGLHCFLLVHSADEDARLARSLVRRMITPVPIVLEADPLILKGILGRCRCVVSSRYHGLVNALGQGVPVLATAWSHKYRALLDDFGCGRYLLQDLSDRGRAVELLEEITGPAGRTALSQQLTRGAERHRQQTVEMWHQVRQLLCG